jgi:hypothetical protein
LNLYHFTPAHLLPGCLAEGLTRGAVPVDLSADGMAQLQLGYQWLTANPAWTQDWNVRQVVRYDRAACRITLAVPKSARGRLYRWVSICRALAPRTWEDLNAAGDPQNWYLYKGRVPPGWFRRVDRRPGDQGSA